jgi:hypothetical protein
MFSHLKRRVGVFTAVAVVAALAPIMSISPASAAANVATVEAVSAAATYSACPTGSAPAAGFTDTTSTDVDCIKMHGITTGVTATTYEPTASIPRWQMALYLTRAATSMGLTLGSGADQGFTDISGYAADIQTAINQLAQLTVTLGTTATTFSPDGNVTREQMAMFIERLLGLTTPGPGGSALATKVGVAIGGYNYTDIDSGSVTFEGHNAILELFELGVTGDTAALALTYRPSADMTRAEMATFMTNALAHSNARPEGLTLQTDLIGACATCFGAQDPQLHISHRDASRQPITGTLVDVFSDLNTTLTSTAPFGATGACTTSNTDAEGGATECKIAVGDNSTDSYGNIAVNPTDTATGTTRDYWAWTGATGVSYNNLTAPGATVQTIAALAATALILSEDVPAYSLVDGTDANHYFVPFGTTITVTGQLKNASGLATPQALVAVSVAETSTIENDLGDGTVANANASTMVSAKTTVLYTDATGAISYTMTAADPAPAVGTLTNRTLVNAVFTSTPTAVNADGASTTSVKLAFNDDTAYNGSVSLTQGSYYGMGLPLALGGVARTALASVWDQYGRARANQTVTFEQTTSDGNADNLTDSFTDDITRVTNSSGVATLGFTDINTETGAHTVWAWHEAVVNGTRASNAAEPEASSVFYRTESNNLGTAIQNASSVEVDVRLAAEVGGEGAIFAIADTGVFTFAADHLLAINDSIIISVTCGGGATVLAGWVLYAIEATEALLGGTAARTATFSQTRGGAIHVPAAAETACQAGQLETWEANDVFYELVYWDDASNTIVVRHQTAAASGNAAFDYNSYTYEADDQFMKSGDNSVTLPALNHRPALTTLAGFETELKTKMTLASGYTLASATTDNVNDVYQIVYVNNLADGGVSQFQLGQ